MSLKSAFSALCVMGFVVRRVQASVRDSSYRIGIAATAPAEECAVPEVVCKSKSDRRRSFLK